MDKRRAKGNLTVTITASIVSVLIAIAVLSFIGCGKEEKAGKVTIRYSTWEILPEQVSLLKEIIGMFEERHPDIKVRLELAGGAGGTQKILTQMAGGTAPDVFFWGSQLVPLIASKEQVLDLTPFFEKDKGLIDNYFEKAMIDCTYKGKIYAFPHVIGIYGLYYNKTLFDKAGLSYPDENWTWDDFLGAAIKLTQDTDDDGKIDQFGTMFPEKWYAWAIANGGRLFNEDGTRCLMDSPDTVEAIRFIKDLRFKYNVVPTSSQKQELGGCGGIELFIMGKVTMFSMGSFAAVDFAKKIKNFAWGIAPLPKGKAGRPTTYALGCNCISSQTRHPDEAWEFVKFYAGKEAGMLMAERKYNVPTLKFAVDTYIKPPPEGLNVFVESLKYAQPDWPKEVINFGELKGKIFRSEIELTLLGKKTPEEAIKVMVKKANEFLAENK